MNRAALTKPALGIVMGATLALAATAGASQTSSWFSGVFSTGGSGSASADSALAQVDAAMSAQIKTDAENCGQVGIGASIQTAIGAHSEMAAATPNVESLFDVNDQCFASISQIADLSFAIPSLASILSAAQDAVLKYAQKKVCTAVNKVSGMVATPINQTINSINQVQGFTDINGMANSAISGAMSGIDPQLGSSYKPASTGSYTVNANPFGASQTTFTGGSTATPQPSVAPATAQPQAAAQPAPAASQSFTSWAASLFN